MAELPQTSPATSAASGGDSGLGVPPFRPAPGKTPVFGSGTPQGPTIPSSAPRPPGIAATRPSSPSREAAGERRTLVVGRGISVKGQVQDAERLVVEGQVEAELIEAAELAVSPGGLFKGNAQVEDAEIAGTIDGNLTAHGALIVRASGIVIGTARCRRLQVEDGGQINGKIEMTSDPKPAPATRPVAEAHATP